MNQPVTEQYIATFHTHLSAMQSQRALSRAGVEAVLAPVPRRLSASCGTCVRYRGTDPRLTLLDTDVETVVRLTGETFEVLFQND